MARSKATLGYASRSEAAAAMHERGISGPVIADAIGATPNSIGNLIHHGYRMAARRKLVDAAAARGVTPAILRRAIITAVIEGDLINAVLDDGRDS